MELEPKIKLDKTGEQSEDRNKIMHISTQIETYISVLLNISIGDYENKSVSFGYTSQSLSLNARINLLIDYNVFSNVEKNYFTKFMEIRNKFAHNFGVKDLFDYLVNEEKTPTLNYLEKCFKNEVLHYERDKENVWKLFYCLIDKIEISLTAFSSKLATNAGEMGQKNFRLSFFDCLNEVLDDEQFLKTLPENHLSVIIPFYTEINRRSALLVDNEDSAREKMKGKNLL